MNFRKSIENIILEYQKWVGLNPCTSAEIESAVKYLSYMFTSQFQNSNIISELIYTLSKLLVFFNDQIIYNSTLKNATPNPYKSKLKKWLTIIEHCEVFIELSAQKTWGNYGKWIIIFIVQLFKSVIKLNLLYYHKEQIVESLPIRPLDRKNLENNVSNNNSLPTSNGVSLRNGRMIRIIEAAPSVENRNWQPLVPQSKFSSEDKLLNQYQVNAEVIYIVKPLLHLVSMYCCKQQSWKPWLLAFTLDITSLYLMSKTEKKETQLFSRRQQVEVTRRTVALLMYLMKSPFYDKNTKQYIFNTLHKLSSLPMLGFLFTSINDYIPQWQQTYFYVWSS